jgi:murein DD-endopeptidase MepM/ murein hydrolase activator NlpD
MLFKNPVKGHIYLPGQTKPSGAFRRTQNFGCTGFSWERPYGTCRHFHRGIDLGNGGCGAPVLAARAGTVTYSSTLNGGAITVIIRHGDGWFSGYTHLASRNVARGAKVVAGQQIGRVGSTGYSTACHLHFQLKSGLASTADANDFWLDLKGKYENPWTHLEQNVTIRPREQGVNIRNEAKASGTAFAQVASDGHIRRKSDNADLGSASTWRKYGGAVTGGSYTVNGKTSSTWYKIWLDGAYRYIAALVSERSAS